MRRLIEDIVDNLPSRNLNLNNNNGCYEKYDCENKKEEKTYLIEKCLEEICKLYKYAAFIELLVFILFGFIFLWLNFESHDTKADWKINHSLKKILFKREFFEEIRSKIDSPRDQILIGILKAFRVDLLKNKTVNILLNF